MPTRWIKGQSYVRNARVVYDGVIWLSLAANNVSMPSDSPTWVVVG